MHLWHKASITWAGCAGLNPLFMYPNKVMLLGAMAWPHCHPCGWVTPLENGGISLAQAKGVQSCDQFLLVGDAECPQLYKPKAGSCRGWSCLVSWLLRWAHSYSTSLSRQKPLPWEIPQVVCVRPSNIKLYCLGAAQPLMSRRSGAPRRTYHLSYLYRLTLIKMSI